MLDVLSLGLKPFAEVWEIQKDLQKRLMQGSAQESFIICEHPPVITCGKSTKSENLLVSKEELRALGIELYEIERGGDVTYHGPGQLVGYPILNLTNRKRDVSWYMRRLEAVIIESLQCFGIQGLRAPGKTGVWTQLSGNDKDFVGSKIASLGVRISRWCTLHGFALNVSHTCEQGFSYIHPCGFKHIKITSMQREIGHEVESAAVYEVITERFLQEFG